MKKLLLLVPAIAFSFACSTSGDLGINSPLFDRGFDDNAWEDDYQDDYYQDGQTYTSTGQARMAGSVITAGTLDGHETIGNASMWGSYLEFHFDTFTPDGWAMLAAYGIQTDGSLEAGDVITLDTYDVVGCMGPQQGSYDYDGGAEEGGTITVVEGQNGELVLNIHADFGSTIGVMDATIALEENNY